jgi:hypothetical protein
VRYRVRSLNVSARGNRIYYSGDEVSDFDFLPNAAAELARKGHLEHILPPPSDGNRLCIATMAWQRHHLFETWCMNIAHLRDNCDTGFEIVPVVVGSFDRYTRMIANKYKCNYTDFPNMPLGAKANERLRFCSEFGPDFIMLLGSDDFICADLLREYHRLAMDGNQIIEVSDIYYLHPETGSHVYCEGYINRRRGEPMAVARMFTKEVAEAFNWQMWPNHRKRGMDSRINTTLGGLGVPRTQFSIKDRLLVLDVKTGVNLTKFDAERENWHVIEPNHIKQSLTPEIYARLLGN